MNCEIGPLCIINCLGAKIRIKYLSTKDAPIKKGLIIIVD